MNSKNHTKITLAFRVDLLPTWKGYSEYPSQTLNIDQRLELMDKEASFIQKLYKSIGLKPYSRFWTEIDLTPENCQKLYHWISALESNGVATFGSGNFFEEDIAPPQEEDWFAIRSVGFGHENLNDHHLYPSCKACKLPTGDNLLVGSYASAKMKEAVEKYKLKGLEFLWLKDIGKYLAPQQWYLALTKHCMGHGVDHPWFDPQNDKESKELSPKERYGNNSVDPRNIKKNWSSDCDLLDQLLKKFPTHTSLGFHFQSMYRFQKKFIPKDTDFAYFWHSKDSFTEDGVPDRHRKLCVTARAREVLIQNKVFKPDHFEKVLLLDELTEGQVDLDTGHPVLPPIRTAEEWAELKKMEAVYWAEYQAKPKLPKKPATLKQVLKLLRERKKDDDGDFTKGTRKADLPAPCPPLPEAWAKVLAVSNGFEVYDTNNSACIARSVQDLPAMQEEYGKDIELEDQLTCHHLFFIATNECGDIYAFLYDNLTHPLKDCPVVRIDHEVMHIDHTWPTIPEFLEAVMTQ